MRVKWWCAMLVATFPAALTWAYVGYGMAEFFLITTSLTWYAIWTPYRLFKEQS